jgi:hypothetical protein
VKERHLFFRNDEEGSQFMVSFGEELGRAIDLNRLHGTPGIFYRTSRRIDLLHVVSDILGEE